MEEEAAGRGAPLARGTESSKGSGAQGELHVGIRENGRGLQSIASEAR